MRDRQTITRRDFLQAAGFSLAAAASACQRTPPPVSVHAAARPDAPPAGARLNYATVCGGCSAGCGVLASVRDGRAVKLEGLPDHPVSRGALCAGGQATILGLYDTQRLRRPQRGGAEVSWETIDESISKALHDARGAVRVLTGTDAAASPTSRAAIARFLRSCRDGRHDVCDVLSAAALAEAHRSRDGVGRLPRLRFDRADVVVAFEADFLGTWISPVEFAAAYSARRPRLHVQVESLLTLSGMKADRRLAASPDEIGPMMWSLAGCLARRAGHEVSWPEPDIDRRSDAVEALAASLWEARPRALIVSGSTDPQLQSAARFMNELLGGYGATLDLCQHSRQRLGSDAAIAQLQSELAQGEVEVLILAGVNPVHALPEGSAWARHLTRVPTLIAVSDRLDETSRLAQYVCPPPHPLESWGDYEPVAGVLCLRQPAVVPAGDTRSFDASLSTWMGEPLNAQEIVRAHWQSAVFDPGQDGDSFQDFWDRTLQRGWVERPRRESCDLQPAAMSTGWSLPAEPSTAAPLLLVGYPNVALLDGRQGDNPWLLELPDPVNKVTWDGCASLSPATAVRLGVSDGDLVRILPAATESDGSDTPAPGVELPVIVQPGQHDTVVAVPIGFGLDASRRFSNLGPAWIGAARDAGLSVVGANVAPLLRRAPDDHGIRPTPVRIVVTGRRRTLARSQHQDRLQSLRPGAWGAANGSLLVRRMQDDRRIERDPHAEPSVPAADLSLWGRERSAADIQWGMVIDLDACTGCSACVVACQVENNTPVVGRDEMSRQRGMHWLRIERYYLEVPDSTSVAVLPMTCQHCANAPCETVCPVLATTRSSDGLNQQTYSRCIGTRYCMNNCPFKVRVFNWFDYARDSRLQSRVVNPDVTVRSRGVAEKCTFCVQRIQEARLEARRLGVDLADGDVVPACAQTCPTEAITFGNLNDPSSRVSQRARDVRAYRLLDDLNVQPAISYLALARRTGLAGGGGDGD